DLSQNSNEMSMIESLSNDDTSLCEFQEMQTNGDVSSSPCLLLCLST
ncbi:NR2C1 isoform 10, partial [Pan troglodytes]